MIGVDTNVLLRYLVADDQAQAERAAAFLTKRDAESPAFVSLLVLVEFVWVLRRRYRYPQERIVFAIESMMESPGFVFEEHAELTALLRVSKVKAGDLADHLIALLARRAGCTHTVTFDVEAADRVPTMQLLP